MKRKKTNPNSGTKKRVKFYLLSKEKEVLETGSKRKIDDMFCEYKNFMSELSIVDEDTYHTIKRRKLMTHQSTEYETARLKDLETDKLKQLKEDFKDPEKRRKIIYDSYVKLLESK
jgi:DNA repair ATPase RecN